MSQLPRDCLPASDEMVPILRDAGVPLYDQLVIGAILDSDATPDDKRTLLLMHNCAADFASDDPALWSQAADLLAHLQTLAQHHQEGTIDVVAYVVRTHQAMSGCSSDRWLALLALHRAQWSAFEHVLRRRMSRN